MAAGVNIFLISREIYEVFDLTDRVRVLKNGQLVDSAPTKDVTKHEVLSKIILSKCPQGATPGQEILDGDG